MPIPRVRLLIAALAVTGSLLTAAPALAGEAAVGVEAGPSPDLVRFDTSTPGSLVARVPVSGLPAGETVLGIDIRPATGELWALTSANRVMTIDIDTGAATQRGPAIATSPPFSADQPGGFDFNPVVDRLRLVSVTDENLRYDPLALAPVDSDSVPGNGDTPDSSLAYAAADINSGQDPSVVAAAYTNNDGATATTLFGIDANDRLVRIGGVDGSPSPNLGELSTIGELGTNVEGGGFDVVGTSNVAFAALHPLLGGSTLYTVNLATGQLSGVGAIAGERLGSFAMLPAGAARTSVPSTEASEAGGAVTVTVERSGESLAPATVSYRTADHTAVAGQDYGAVAGTLDFAQGERSKDVSVPLLQDSTLEAPESFALVLGPTSGGIALDTREHAVRLLDDERSEIRITVGPDRTRPTFLFAPQLPDHLRALGRVRRLKLDVACSERCAVKLSLKLGRTRIGAGRAKLDRAGVKRATVRLTKAGRRAVTTAAKARKRGRVALKLSGSATDAAGNVARRTATLRLARR
jgi:hypothetical protein